MAISNSGGKTKTTLPTTSPHFHTRWWPFLGALKPVRFLAHSSKRYQRGLGGTLGAVTPWPGCAEVGAEGGTVLAGRSGLAALTQGPGPLCTGWSAPPWLATDPRCVAAASGTTGQQSRPSPAAVTQPVGATPR